MLKLFKDFTTSEDGAVTIDWVVLTALILGFQIIILVGVMEGSMVEVSDGTAGKIESYSEFLE